jgi:hypothetical protein
MNARSLSRRAAKALRIVLAALPCCAAAMLAGCAAERVAGDAGTVARREVPAPIESAELVVRESSPPQVAVRITSGLPSGCARFARIEVARGDTRVEISVWNSVPADDSVVCTMIYGTAANVAELGSGLVPGRSYDVEINGAPWLAFTAE